MPIRPLVLRIQGRFKWVLSRVYALGISGVSNSPTHSILLGSIGLALEIDQPKI